MKTRWMAKRAAIFWAATALVLALVVHSAHEHEGGQASQLHATCVVCQLGAPVATHPAPLPTAVDAAPACYLSIADRDHAIPPARVEVDLSRAPPALLAS